MIDRKIKYRKMEEIMRKNTQRKQKQIIGTMWRNRGCWRWNPESGLDPLGDFPNKSVTFFKTVNI